MTPARRSIFDGAAPRWYSIDAHRPFLTDLARSLYGALAADDPTGLSEAIVFTPTRRGARALADAFVAAAGGRPVLLPQIRAIGDLEEGEPPFEPGDLAIDLPPAVSPMRRRFELARLAHDHADRFEGFGSQGALGLADALAAFIDSCAIEGVQPPIDPSGLVTGEQAKHWAVSATALRIATDLWPRRLDDLGLVDVAARRTALLTLLAERWRATPPTGPVVAAGSTGSAPATAALLKVIAEAPQGLVVLPGLDRDLAASAWAAVGEDHPQGALRRLLDLAEVTRDHVRPWPNDESAAVAVRGRSRRRVISEALRPASTTSDWVHEIAALRREGVSSGADPIAEGFDGLTLVSARAEEEAAAAIALLMREALETAGRTAALATPDAGLARRVSARLARWRIEADSSAGRPLAETPVGVLLGLIARALATGFDPPVLLALLKHPLVTVAADPVALRTLERRGFRCVRPRGWEGLAQRIEAAHARHPEDGERIDAALALAEVLRRALEPLQDRFAGGEADAGAAAEALARVAEALGGLAVWNGQAGEAASALIAELIETGAVLPPLTARGFADLVRELLEGQTVRPGGALHPRLMILGAIEARLVRADLVILAGLEEGVWPRLPPIDPFFSRPMRAAIGLPPPERRIGLSAHDFAQAACAPEVVLVTTERRGGQPAVRSRWLWRLETLARGADTPDRPVKIPRRPELLDWARRLDGPREPRPDDLKPADRPAPTPPVEARPRKLPVTQIETWVRDPYALYARAILGLRPLDPPDAPMDARARGTAIHRAFQDFAEAHAEAVPLHGAALFERLMTEALRNAGVGEAAMARELTLARRLADWAAAFERERRIPGRRFLIEQEGAHRFEIGDRVFEVTAKADRIEIDLDRFHVLDFKTGHGASRKQMEQGFAPQLTLTAAILMAGGFEGVGGGEPDELIYVRVTGRRIAGEAKAPLKPGSARMEAEKALAGLKARVERFDREDQAYRSWTAPQFISDRGRGDYDHLARVFEWRVTGGGEDGE